MIMFMFLVHSYWICPCVCPVIYVRGMNFCILHEKFEDSVVYLPDLLPTDS